jgi:tetratricopeptide (TPR) repeat protein
MQVHQQRGRVFMLLARYDAAMGESERMLALAREAHDRRAEGEALADLAFAYWATFKTEHVPNVKRFAEEARVIAEETGDQHVLARSLTYLGSFDQIGGHLLDSDAKFEASLQICEAAGFKDHMPQNLVWLGANANWRGEWAKAIETSRRAAAAAIEVHDGLSELFSNSFASLAHIALGEYAEGLAKLHDTLRKAHERNNAFFQGRITNTLGWFYQELGDFRRAHELNRESLDLARRINNSNVEISAAINIGLDYLAFGEAPRAVSHLEETLTRVEKFGYGAHRWRWTIHTTTYLAEALLAAGDAAAALVQAERALAEARAIGCMKYVGKCFALLGQIAVAERNSGRAIEEFGRALAIARQLGYSPLTWQVAHRLASSEWGAGKQAEAFTHAQLAAETIATMASRIPEPALRETFLAWQPVNEAQALLERLRRS